MDRETRKRPQIGDIVEITTAKGCAYALYSHEHATQPRMGSLLRVLPGIYSECPKGFSDLAKQKEQFAVFFPLRAALRQKIVKIVGHESVPDWAIPFPVFRNGTPDRNGKVHDWWLWNGEKEWKHGKLTPEILSYPDLAIVNDTRLVEMIETRYRPEDYL